MISRYVTFCSNIAYSPSMQRKRLSPHSPTLQHFFPCVFRNYPLPLEGITMEEEEEKKVPAAFQPLMPAIVKPRETLFEDEEDEPKKPVSTAKRVRILPHCTYVSILAVPTFWNPSL